VLERAQRTGVPAFVTPGSSCERSVDQGK
jgi:hypothetical protein